jgi:tetratricopeptide (TPR) repeat protein
MRIPEVLERVINWPSPTALLVTLAVATVLIVLAAVLSSQGKWRWVAYALGSLGVVSMLVPLVLVQAQTVRDVQGEGVTVTRSRYSGGTRTLALATLIGLPVVSGSIGLGIWMANRRRLRGQVPRHIKAGRMHYFQGEYEAALTAFNRAIQIAPQLAEAYCGRGSVYQAIGQTELALADLGRAIARDPRLTAAYIQRGKIRTETGEFDAALDDFGRVMEIRPADPELYLHRGVCLLKNGQIQEAAADFHRVLKLTNHSDYADPARAYLKELEGGSQPPRPITGGNGALTSPLAPQPKSEDYTV